MSASSVNLSDRIFLTIQWIDETAYIGELKGSPPNGKQKILVELTNEELRALTGVLSDLKEDICYHPEGTE